MAIRLTAGNGTGLTTQVFSNPNTSYWALNGSVGSGNTIIVNNNTTVIEGNTTTINSNTTTINSNTTVFNGTNITVQNNTSMVVSGPTIFNGPNFTIQNNTTTVMSGPTIFNGPNITVSNTTNQIFQGSNGGTNIYITGANNNSNSLIISNGNGGQGVIYDSFFNPPTYTSLVVSNAPFGGANNGNIANFNVNVTGNYLISFKYQLNGVINSNPSTDAFLYFVSNRVNNADLAGAFLTIPTININFIFGTQLLITKQLNAGSTYNVGVTIFGTPNVTSASFFNVSITKLSN